MINLNNYKVLGLLYDLNAISRSELLYCITSIQIGCEDFTPVKWCNHEIAVSTIDYESAQKYGKMEQLLLSQLVVGLGSSLTNFYYEFDHINHKDHSCDNKSAYELIEYISNLNGYLFLVGQVPSQWVEYANKMCKEFCKISNASPRRFKKA